MGGAPQSLTGFSGCGEASILLNPGYDRYPGLGIGSDYFPGHGHRSLAHSSGGL
jgi:hypothetical protein